MPLSEVQRRVAEIVFALAEGEGFALAGGGALIAHDIVNRTTRDLDCFGPSRDAVDQYWPAIVVALNEAAFVVEVRVASHGFAKLTVSDSVTGDTTQVDIGFDPAGRAAVTMSFGRVRALDDLFARCRQAHHEQIGSKADLGPI
jgi:Nucleotidyl transferase AbiEii toxin, Type IV TA system